MVSNFDLNRTALNNQMMGLSTDTKPTTGILPNSLFWELDTNGMYYFDGTQWQSIGGSGGGGGGESTWDTWHVIVNAPVYTPNLYVSSEYESIGDNDIFKVIPVDSTGKLYYAIMYPLDNGASNLDIPIAVFDDTAELRMSCNEADNITVSVTGNIRFVNDEGWFFYVTGDGTITFTAQ